MNLNYDSTKLIGDVKKRFKQLERKNWEWRSFYNGWIEGRAKMLNELREGKPETTSANGLHKHFVSVSDFDYPYITKPNNETCEHPLNELMFWGDGTVECKLCEMRTVKF